MKNVKFVLVGILTILAISLFFSAISHKDEYQTLSEDISSDTLIDYIQDNYSPSDIWDDEILYEYVESYAIDHAIDHIVENYSPTDIWDEETVLWSITDDSLFEHIREYYKPSDIWN